MSKARTLANLISDNAELADGQISVAEVVGAAPTASPTFTGNIDAGDNVKIRLGDSDDLQIYHDGSTSIIKETGSGDLRLQGANIDFKDPSGQTYAYFNDTSGAVSLYHNNSPKLATTSAGIAVTGTSALGGDTTVTGTLAVSRPSSGYGGVEVGGSSGGLIDLKAPFADDYDARIIYNNDADLQIITLAADEPIVLKQGNSTRLSTTTTGIDVTGAILIDNTTNSPDQTLMVLQADLGTNDRNMQIKSPATDSASAPFRFTTGNSFAFEIDSTTDALVIDASANVGIGTDTPLVNLHIQGTGSPQLRIQDTDGTNQFSTIGHNNGLTTITSRNNTGSGDIAFRGLNSSTEFMRLSSNGNVGISQPAPAALLHVGDTSNVLGTTSGNSLSNFTLQTDTTNSDSLLFTTRRTANGSDWTTAAHRIQRKVDTTLMGYMEFGHNVNSLITFGENNSEYARIDGAGSLLVGKTALSTSAVGCELRANGKLVGVIDGGNHTLGRLTSNGDIVKFAKDDITVGSLGIETGGFVIDGEASHTGMRFSSTSLLPRDNGVDTDNAVNLGADGLRFKHLFISEGITNPTAGGQMTFDTAGAEAMRIDSSGNLLVSKTALSTSTVGVQATALGGVYATRSSGSALVLNRKTSTGTIATFMYDTAVKGSISVTGSATAYNTSSDYRLKENVVDLTGASARVNQLDVKRFNFIADDTNTLVDGFLAHEVADVVPEAITGTKDAMMDEEYEVTPAVEATYDEEGNELTAAVEAVMGTRSVPDYQGIDQSKLVPLLTAALQEALTEIASLKTRVEALEG